MSRRRKGRESPFDEFKELENYWPEEELLDFPDYYEDDQARLSRLKKSGKRFHQKPTHKSGFDDD